MTSEVINKNWIKCENFQSAALLQDRIFVASLSCGHAEKTAN